MYSPFDLLVELLRGKTLVDHPEKVHVHAVRETIGNYAPSTGKELLSQKNGVGSGVSWALHWPWVTLKCVL